MGRDIIGVLALEPAKNPRSGERGSTCLDEFHRQPVFNERIFVETQVCAPRKEVLPLFPLPGGAANSSRVTGRKMEISFRKLRDDFCSGKNRSVQD